jgi:RNA polymerase sigma-70 factor (ECF subfamily)
MPTHHEFDTGELIERAGQGDARARQQLLVRHQRRLRQMVAYRMDARLAARIDPSDVVQETLLDAALRLSEYLRNRPLPFYPWLRQLAFDRLVELNRLHLRAKKRSVEREEPGLLQLPEDSAVELAGRLAANGLNPNQSLLREELRGRVRSALRQLPARDREVLVLRHLEHLSVKECAAALHIKEGAVKVRHLRALDRLRQLLEAEGEEGRP